MRIEYQNINVQGTPIQIGYSSDITSFMVDIYTPFGENVDEIHLRECLEERLFPDEICNGNLIWSILCEEETSQGMLNRLICIPQKEISASFQKIEFLWPHPLKSFLGVLQAPVKVPTLYFSTSNNHFSYLGVENQNILFCGWENPVSDPNKRLNQWERYFTQKPTLLEANHFESNLHTLPNLFKEINVLPQSHITKMQQKKFWIHSKRLWLKTLAVCAILICLCTGLQFWLSYNFEKTKTIAAELIPHLDEIERLEKQLQIENTSLQNQNSLWKKPIVHYNNILLLSNILPNDGKLLSLKIQGLTYKSTVELKNWDSAEKYQKDIEANNSIKQFTFSKKSRKKNGHIRFTQDVLF